jgi:hypothetical protein
LRVRRASRPAIGLLMALGGLAPPVRAADPVLRGRVVDEAGSPVGGARILLQPESEPGGAPSRSWRADSDAAGNFTLELPLPGGYLVTVTCPGYFEVRARAFHVEASQELSLVLNHVREVFQSLDVNGEPSPLDAAAVQQPLSLTGTEINNLPYPNSHSLRSSLKLMPGVLLDPSGELHFHGASEDQIHYRLNGYNTTNPITTQFSTLLAVEGVRTVEFHSGGEQAGNGTGSAGTLSIATDSGSDVFRHSVTGFVPGLNFQQGVRLGNWYPRVAVSGPIRRGRAWFSDTLGFEYNSTLVPELPAGENTATWSAGANYLQGQFNWSPTHILFVDFLVNVSRRHRAGLGVLDPLPTTSELRGHEYLAGFRDYVYLARGALIDFGYAHGDFSTTQTPQGTELYLFSPDGRKGNYFVASRRSATRDQTFLHGVPPAFRLAGTHRLDAGLAAEFLGYDAGFRRTGYELIGLSGAALSLTSFRGSGVYHVPDTHLDWHLSDTWQLSERLQVILGVRQDWDRRIPATGWSPWFSVSWAPFRSGSTRIAGGYTIARDAVSLGMLGRPLDQIAFTTRLNTDGSPSGAPVPTAFMPLGGPLSLPYSANWNISLDRRFLERYDLRLHYLRRRLRDGFVYVNTLSPDAPPYALPLPNGVLPGAYRLMNRREDRYDSVELSARRSFSGQYEVMVSYTYSRASSNALLQRYAPEPLATLPYSAPVAWDAPHRVLGWAYLPLPWKNWAFAALLDVRTGFPFSITGETGLVSGPVNSHRYPLNADLNLGVERMITLGGRRFALRAGVNNVTNQANFTAVNNVIGSPHFLEFQGREGRHYVLRLRFFGRSKGK